MWNEKERKVEIGKGRRKESGYWKREEQVILRLECGRERAMETEMWRRKSKERERKKREERCF